MLFDGDGGCANCHGLVPEAEGDVGPTLAGHGTPAYWARFVALPSHPRYFGEASAMPPFYDELGPEVRAELGAWLASLREQPWPARPEAIPGVYPDAGP